MATPSPRVRALLDSAGWRWNGAADAGTAAFVPYAFAATAGSGGRLLSSAEKDAVRAAMATLEAVCGVRFLELDLASDATAGALVISAATLGDDRTGATSRSGDGDGTVVVMVLDSATLDDGVAAGSWGFHAILRQLGFVLGLGEPDAGAIRLPVSEDTTAYTMMSTVYTDPADGPRNHDQDALAHLFGADLGGLSHTWNGATHRLEVVGTAGGDRLLGTAFADLLEGGDGDDTLIGRGVLAGGGGDVLRGQGGDDWIITASDSDLAEGGTGNDVLEGPGTLSGGGGDDVLTGDGTLLGGDGDDDLSGGGLLVGGDGNDVYRIPLGAAPTIVETAGGGIDTVFAKASVVTLDPWLEILIYSGTSAFTGTGNSQDNRIVGGLRADTLSGLGGADTLEGGDGADWLDGGTGADTLVGGAGNDTYVVDQAGDVVVETAGGGTDTVRAGLSWTLGDHVENLVLTGTAAINGTGNALANVITGNRATNTLDGGAGADTLSGGGGDDVYLVDHAGDVVIEAAGGGFDTVRAGLSWTLPDHVEALVLTGTAALDGTGNALDNVITGTSAANTLDGRGGADTLSGGDGDDVYAVDQIGDVVVEAAGEGFDTVRASLSWTLGSHLEALTLTGTAALDGTGNGLANVITGNGAANTLDGKGGADTLIGGAGNDVYVVDQAGDVVVETANGGTDTVRAGLSWTLGSHVENLVLTGTAAINGTGNALANVITGNGAANVLDGGAGDDTYHVDAGDVIVETASGGNDVVYSAVSYTLPAHVETLILTSGTTAAKMNGNAFANRLVGNAGHNRLDGGLGADTMTGGAGNDTYVVDNPRDVVIETANAGLDIVESSAAAYTLPRHVERLVLTGRGNIAATALHRGAVVSGNQGANRLTGGAGVTLAGGQGNDTYEVQAGTVVREQAGGGRDTVLSAVSWTLGAHLEVLHLTAPGARVGQGNGLDNIIRGSNGANTLAGGAGADTLTGGGGADRFVFDAVGRGVDRVSDFTRAQGDRLVLRAADLGAAPPRAGRLAAAAFLAGAGVGAGVKAATPGQRVLFDTRTGRLYIDRDGSGRAAPVLVATLTVRSLEAADILVAT